MVTLGERLKMARAMSGFSLRELAERAGVSHMAVSKYERGLDVPSSAVLLRLAEALSVKLDYLFRSSTVVLDPAAVHFRCGSMCGAKARNQVRAEVVECTERTFDVEKLLGERRPFGKPAFDLEVSSVEDVERVALDLRNAWELGLGPIVNLIAVLENRGVRVCLIQGSEGFDGLSAWIQGEIPVIAIQRGIPGDRQRFDLAHELAYLLFGLSPSTKEEAVALRFARALLVPELTARAELGDRRRDLSTNELYLLKHKHGLSMQAWVRRAQDLDIIDEAAYQRICQRFIQMGWRRQEPGKQVPSEEPGRMKQLVFRALAEDVISRSRAQELLDEPLSEMVPELA